MTEKSKIDREESIRTEPGKRGHGPWSNASRAALTAKSTSSLSPSAILAITSPVLGSIVSNVFPIYLIN
jgi:hypothetical protein